MRGFLVYGTMRMHFGGSSNLPRQIILWFLSIFCKITKRGFTLELQEWIYL